MAEDRKPVSTISRGKTPVTWHPLFPAIVAVWFGALFGLGVLAVRTALLEAAVLSLGIDGLISAAAPPLGATARILLALGFAMVGAVIGGAVGLLMARSRPDAVARRTEAAAAKAAAKAEAEAARIAAAEISVPAEPVTEPSEAHAYFDISQLDLDEDLRIEPQPEPEIEVLAADEALAEPELKPARAFERPLDPVSFPLPDSFPVPGGAAAARLTSASLDSLSHLELIERLALSLQKRREEAGPEQEEAASQTIDVDAAIVPTPLAPSYYPTVSDDAAERGYASLLGLSRPAIAEEEEGTSIARFPEPAGHRPNSEATERALRDALATLQRMSGAA